MEQNFSFNELVSYLKDMNKEYGSLSYYLFAIKYGESLKDKNLTKIVRSAGLTESMSKELSKGMRLYKVLKSDKLGLLSKGKSDIQNPNTQINYFLTDLAINNSILYLTALRTKPFMLLAGISGTGKSRIVRKLAQGTVTEELQRANGYTGEDFANDRWTLHSPANFELIQVKPNWHNSMDVIGYLSNIPSPHYVFTPFIEFIVKAWQHPEVPFFLCLDEMNLAPVEEYFAEFLSAIESRSFEGEEYLTDPIIKPFNSFGEEVAKKMVNTLFPNFTAAAKNSF